MATSQHKTVAAYSRSSIQSVVVQTVVPFFRFQFGFTIGTRFES